MLKRWNVCNNNSQLTNNGYEKQIIYIDETIDDEENKSKEEPLKLDNLKEKSKKKKIKKIKNKFLKFSSKICYNDHVI